jgi:hypothetical protein
MRTNQRHIYPSRTAPRTDAIPTSRCQCECCGRYSSGSPVLGSPVQPQLQDPTRSAPLGTLVLASPAAKWVEIIFGGSHLIPAYPDSIEAFRWVPVQTKNVQHCSGSTDRCPIVGRNSFTKTAFFPYGCETSYVRPDLIALCVIASRRIADSAAELWIAN